MKIISFKLSIKYLLLLVLFISNIYAGDIHKKGSSVKAYNSKVTSTPATVSFKTKDDDTVSKSIITFPKKGTVVKPGEIITIRWETHGASRHYFYAYTYINGKLKFFTYGSLSGSTTSKIITIPKEAQKNVTVVLLSYNSANKNIGQSSIYLKVKSSPNTIKAPSNLEASNKQQTTATLTWKDNANNETGYNLTCGSTINKNLPANTHEYALKGLTKNTNYSCSVKAYNSKATSTPATVSFKTKDGGNGNITKPIIIQNIKAISFEDENRSFIITYDKNGTISSTCGSVSPNIIKANTHTTLRFQNLGVGTHEGCKITVTHADSTQSKPTTLNTFVFQKVLATTKIRGRSDGKGLDYVIIADGFQENEMDLFRTKARAYANHILNYDNKLSLEKNAWNIFLIETVSKQSGADNVDGQNGIQVDTALDSHFWCYNTERLLCINSTKVTATASKYVPQYDKVLVIVNSSKYGGAGGNYATTSLGAGGDIATHELGHSLAGLADEYEYGHTNPPSSEPHQSNVTINNDTTTVKWKHWLDKPEVGLFEGGLYVKKGVWRPTNNSIMRNNGQPFYSINAEQWALAIYKTAGVIYSKVPKLSNIFQIDGENTIFTIEASIGNNAQKIIWKVDDVTQSVPNNNFTFTFGENKHKNYNVKAIISDKTGVIRKDDHNYSTKTVEWNITVN